MKNPELIANVLSDELARVNKELDFAQERLTKTMPVMNQLDALAAKIINRPEIQAIRGEDFSSKFIPTLFEMVQGQRVTITGGEIHADAPAETPT